MKILHDFGEGYLIGMVCLLTLLSCEEKTTKDMGSGDQTDTIDMEQQTVVLVFSKTAGYRHESISDGNEAMIRLGESNDFKVVTTVDAAYFTEDSLDQFAAVLFLNTTGDVLNRDQEAAFENYIQSGGGFVGVHSATDTEYDWSWYGRLVGGYFNGHPAVQDATMSVKEHNHPATAHLSDTWVKQDEWYNFRNMNEELSVLITVDEQTYEGGTMGDPHPVSWYHEFDGGRAFYTAMGHTKASFSNSLFLKHLSGGLLYVMDRQ